MAGSQEEASGWCGPGSLGCALKGNKAFTFVAVWLLSPPVPAPSCAAASLTQNKLLSHQDRGQEGSLAPGSQQELSRFPHTTQCSEQHREASSYHDGFGSAKSSQYKEGMF